MSNKKAKPGSPESIARHIAEVLTQRGQVATEPRGDGTTRIGILADPQYFELGARVTGALREQNSASYKLARTETP